ncbi:hypothetical protein KAR91_29035 [Candidatus Pacearchaeota archaeon]|nr:hypothetical protein [Candidatus Pacearchaeota archaeon]
MSTIKKHLENILAETAKLNMDNHVTEPDEFATITDIEIAVYAVRKVFERTKKIEE